MDGAFFDKDADSMQVSQPMNAPRSLDPLSLGKAIACILVVAQHTLASHFGVFGHGWNLTNVLDSLTRVAVPIFLMTSGAIFLERDDSFSYFYTRRLLRIALPLLFWSIVYAAWISLNGNPIGNWISAILHGPVMYHLWYFYAIFGLSLITPVLAPWFQSADHKAHWAFIGTWFTFTALLPLVGLFSTPLYGITFATGYSVLDFGGYLVLGAVLKRRSVSVPTLRWLGFSLYILGTAGIALATRNYSEAAGRPQELFYYNNSVFVVIAAAGIFLAIQNMSISSPTMSWILGLVSACSLGIYGIHPLVMALIFKYWGQFELSPASPPMSVIFSITLIVSLLIVWILRRFPPMRKVM